MREREENDLVQNGAMQDPIVAITRKDYNRLVKRSTYSETTLSKIKTVPASWVFASGAAVDQTENAEKDPYLDGFVMNWPYEGVATDKYSLWAVNLNKLNTQLLNELEEKDSIIEVHSSVIDSLRKQIADLTGKENKEISRLEDKIDFYKNQQKQMTQRIADILDMEETRKKRTYALFFICCLVSFTIGALLGQYFH